MLQKREQMWWLGACVIGMLIAAWAAGGFIGPLLAVFIVLFLAGAVLVEVEGRDRIEAAPGGVQAGESEPGCAPEPDEVDADVPEAAKSLA